ncbi:MADS-box transcription factor 4-like isoform X2 [Zingiber officinale]|uniref:MADS-box transcription factor 4-like isoform X2 n=1 Tax=Zingiber officinale TaxID=94328 RepID=UPI001C4C3938|nr:MADS-box transcription factor 4-like isoform X2 [Zingiber officinale]
MTYQTNSGEKLWDAKHESLSVEIERLKKENDNMHIELRHLKGEDLNSLYPKELIPIEEALQIGLTSVREKQMEIWKMHKKNEKFLEENKQLTYMLLTYQLDPKWRNECLSFANSKWRQYKTHLTKTFIQPNRNNLKLLNKVPQGHCISPGDWSSFVINRMSEDFIYCIVFF